MKEMLKVKRRDGLVLAIFYAVVGIVHLGVLAASNFALVTSGILAVLCFVAAFGLFAVKKWAVWLVIGLFFPLFVFGALTLYATFLQYIAFPEVTLVLINVGFAALTLLTFVSFVYVASKRKSFQEA
jgi:uncharacterized membrane protein (DUF2068 family)